MHSRGPMVSQSPRLPKPHLVINDWGGSIGGPVFKNKLFFFGNFSGRIQPGGSTPTATVPTLAALGGTYSYFNASGCRLRRRSTSCVRRGERGIQSECERSHRVPGEANDRGSYQYGTFTQTPTQLDTRTLNFQVPTTATTYYPAFRVDYTLTNKLQTSLSFNMTKAHSTGNYPAILPGPFFQAKTTGNFSKELCRGTGHRLCDNAQRAEPGDARLSLYRFRIQPGSSQLST